MALSSASTSSVGNPRFGLANNPFVAGNAAIGQQRSYLAQIGGAGGGGSDGQFALPDSSSIPIALLEQRFTQSITDTVRGLIDRTLALHQAAGTLLSGTPDTRNGVLASQRLDISLTPSSTTLPVPGVFSRRVATSDDSAVQASVQDNALRQTYLVDVLSLETTTSTTTTTTTAAVAQQNAGSTFAAGASRPMTSANSATLRLVTNGGGTTTDIPFDGTNGFNIAGGDDAQTSLQTVADAINFYIGSDVTATVNSAGGNVQLIVTSNTAGTAGAFTVSDLSGDIASTTGIGTVTTAAADSTTTTTTTTTTTPAQVRINGVEQSADSNNQLALDPQNSVSADRLTLFFKAVTDSTVTVTVGVALDVPQVVDAADKLVSKVNDLRSYVADKADILSKGLLSRMDAVMGDLKAPLASIGITQDAAGQITVDDTKLTRALNERPNEVERTIGYVNGFASRELAVANALLRNPGLAFAGRGGAADVLAAQLTGGATPQFGQLLPSGVLVNRQF